MSDDPFRPSEYTAALLRQLRLDGPCTGRVLEMGTGSGVVLAALAAAGAREVVGVDLEPGAVQRTRELLRSQGGVAASVRCGDLWQALADERFDLIAFNPPQLPLMSDSADGSRLHSWSDGGTDGRDVLDRFLCGLDRHLAPGARALITHSSFLDLERTRQSLAARALQVQVRQTVCVQIAPYKLRALPTSWLERQLGQSLHRVGPYVFTDFHVLEIRHANDAKAR